MCLNQNSLKRSSTPKSCTTNEIQARKQPADRTYMTCSFMWHLIQILRNSQLPSQQVPPVRMITTALLSPFLPPASSHTHRHQPAVPTKKGFLINPSTPSAYCWLHSCSVLLPAREMPSAFLCPSLAGALCLQLPSLRLP